MRICSCSEQKKVTAILEVIKRKTSAQGIQHLSLVGKSFLPLLSNNYERQRERERERGEQRYTNLPIIAEFFHWRLVNQQRQINDCVFRLLDASKYLTTLRSNISPCQEATTLLLISLYNPSFHLWTPLKKSLSTTVFLSWMPFKICDCDKFLSTTTVTQFWLQAVP